MRTKTIKDKKGRSIKLKSDEFSYVNALHDGKIIAKCKFIIHDNEEGYNAFLTHIFVDNSYKKSGIGKQILLFLNVMFDNLTAPTAIKGTHDVEDYYLTEDGPSFVAHCRENGLIK